MLVTAVSPRHLAKRRDPEVHAAHVAPTEVVVAGIEQRPSELHAIEREPKHLLTSHPGLLGEQGLELWRCFARKHLCEQSRERVAALQDRVAQLGRLPAARTLRVTTSKRSASMCPAWGSYRTR